MKRVNLILVVLVLVLALSSHPVLGWYDDGFQNRIQITFDSNDIGENLADFPILVKLNSSRIDYSKTANAGEDIRFVDSDDATLLPHEIEKWNESLDSFVWVKIPQINASSSTDYIYMYYNNPSLKVRVNDTIYNNFYFSASGETSGATGIDFNGTHFYVSSQQNGNELIFEYNRTGDYTGFSFNTSNQTSNPSSLRFNGTHFYVLDSTDNNVYEYNITGGYTGFTFDTSTQEFTPSALDFNGTHFFVAGSGDTVYMYNITGNYTGFSFSTSDQTISPGGIEFVNNYFYVADYTTRRLYSYNASGSYTGLNVTISGDFLEDIFFNGTHFYFLVNTENATEWLPDFDYVQGPNPSDVWVDYIAVWHMNQDPTTSIKDSTASSYNGTSEASMTSTDLVDGFVGNAIDFDGIDDGIDIPSFTLGQNFTYLIWAYSRDNDPGSYVALFGDTSQSRWFGMNSGNVWLDGADNNFSSMPPINQWHMRSIWYNRSDQRLRFFINDSQSGSDVTGDSYATVSDTWNIGYTDPADVWDGFIDEVRISNTTRTDSWINASYKSTLDNMNTYGAEETTSTNFNTCTPVVGTNLVINTTLTCSNTAITISDLNVSGNFTLTNVTLIADNTTIFSGARFDAAHGGNTIWQNGNLTIMGFYNLTNETLRMNGSSDGQIGINVSSTGSMVIAKNSFVANGINDSFNHFFRVYGQMNVTDSTINDSGWEDGGETSRALYIAGTGIRIINSSIQGNETGIEVEGPSLYIEDSTIISRTSGGSFHAALYLDDGDSGTVINGSYLQAHGSVVIWVSGGAGTLLTHNILNLTWTGGIGLANSLTTNDLTAHNNTVYAAGFGISASSGGMTFSNGSIIATSGGGDPIISLSGNAGSANAFVMENTYIESISPRLGIQTAGGLGVRDSSDVFRNVTINSSSSGPVFVGSIPTTNISFYDMNIITTGTAPSVITTRFNKVNFSGTIWTSSDNIMVFNLSDSSEVTIHDMLINTTGVNATALHFSNVTNSDILRTNITNITASFNITGDLFNVTAVDSALRTIFMYGGVASSNRNLTLINATYTSIDQSNCDGSPNCTITVKWYLDVLVNDTTSPVTGATVTVDDINDVQIFSGTTDANGRIETQNFTEFRMQNNTAVYFTNHTINVSHSSYSDVGNITNLTTNRFIKFSLGVPNTVCIDETSICFPTVQQAVENATSGQTVVITDGRIYEENVTIFVNLTITSNGTEYPTIWGNNLSTIRATGISEINLRRLKINVSGTLASQGAVQIADSNLSVNDTIFWTNITGIDTGAVLSQGVSADSMYWRFDRVNMTVIQAASSIYDLFGTGLNTVWIINNSRIIGNTSSYSISPPDTTTSTFIVENSFFNNTDGTGLIETRNITIRHSELYSYSGAAISINGGKANLINLTVEGGPSIDLIQTGNGGESVETFVKSSSIASATFSAFCQSCSQSNTTSDTLTIIDTTVDSPFDLYIRTHSTDNAIRNITIINSTITPADVTYNDFTVNDTANITFKNYLDVLINDSTNPISGATVIVYNNESIQVFNGTTAASGRIIQQNITFLTANTNGSASTNITWFTNHTINVSHASYESAGNITNVSSNRFITFSLTPKATVCIAETGVCWQNITAAVENATANQTVVITDDRAYNENITLDRNNLTLTSNGSAYPTIYYDNQTVITVPSATLQAVISRIKVNITGSADDIRGFDANTANVNVNDVSIWTNTTGTSNVAGYYISGAGKSILNRVNITSFNTTDEIGGFDGNITVNNSRITGTSAFAIESSNFGDVVIENTFINVSDFGIFFGSNTPLIVRNSTVYAPSAAVTAQYEARVIIEDSYINSTAGNAISVNNDTTIRSSTIHGSNNAISTYTLGGNITVIDSVLTWGSFGIRLDSTGTTSGAHNVTVINSTVGPTDVEYNGCLSNETCLVTFINYLDVLVNDSSGPISGATVTVDNSSGGQVFSGSTDGSGRILQQNITYAFENQTDHYWNTNHTVNVTASGYNSIGNITNMSSNRFLTFELSQASTVCVQETSVCWPTIQEAIYNATAGQTVVITDNRTYNENVSINTSGGLILTSNGTSLPLITSNESVINIVPADFGLKEISRLRLHQEGSNSKYAIVSTGNSFSSDLTMQDLVITMNNTNNTAYAIYFAGGGNNRTLNNVTIHMINGTRAIDIEDSTNDIINNSYINGSSVTDFTIFFASDFTLENSEIYGGSSSSVRLTADSNVTNTVILANGGSSSSGISGSFLAANITITNVTINATGSAVASLGLRARITSSVLQGNSYSLSLDTFLDGEANWTVIDTQILDNITVQDGSTEFNVTLLLINTTATPADVSFSVSGSDDRVNITFINYLDVLVNDSSGPISGATVTVDNSTDDQVFSGSTDGVGRIVQQNITFATLNHNGTAANTTWVTNHTVNVSSVDHVGAGQITNMSSSRFLTFALTALSTVCVQETSVCWTNITDAIDNTTQGQTVVITDGRTYNETVNVNVNNLTLTSNGTTLPTVSWDYGNVLNVSHGNITIDRIKFLMTSSRSIFDGAIRVLAFDNTTIQDVFVDVNSTGSNKFGIYSNSAPDFLSIHNVTITLHNGSRGIYTEGSSNVLINNSYVNGTDANGASGIFLSGSNLDNLTILGTQIFIGGGATTGSGIAAEDGLTLKHTKVTSSAGSCIEFGGPVLHWIIENVTSNYTGSENFEYPLVLEGDNVTIRSSLFTTQTLRAIAIDNAASNFTVIDTQLLGTITVQINPSVASNARIQNITLINTTAQPYTTNMFGCTGSNDTCEVSFINYLDVLVNDSSNPISGATVTVDNSSGGQVFSGSTDGSGRIVQQNITFAFMNRTNVTWVTNHTVNVSVNGYDPAGQITNMSNNRFLTFTLTALSTVCVQETSVCWPTIQQAIDNATANQTVVITDDRTYTENVTIPSTKDGLKITSNGTKLPLIIDSNVKPITIDANSVTVERINVTLLNGSSTDAAIEIANQLNTTIQNVYILVNSSVSNNYGIYGNSNSHNTTIKNATITVQNGTAGIYFQDSSNITVENSVIIHQDSAGGQGIRFGGGNEIGLRVIGTRIESNSGGPTSGISITSALELKHSNITVDTLSGVQSTGGVLLNYLIIENTSINYTGSGFSTYAVQVEGNNITIRNSILSATERALAFDHPSKDVNVYDTIINGNNPLRINYNGGGNNIIVNVTLTNTSALPSTTIFTSCIGTNTSCNVTYRNYLDVLVNDSSGPISGATVTVDNSSDIQVFSGSTDGSGLITRQNITYATQNATVVNWATNHTVNVSNAGHVGAGQITNLSSNRFLTFTLTALQTVCVEETSTCWPTVQQAVDNATSEQTVVITDNRTYHENVTVSTLNLTITSNGTGYPTINTSNKTLITYTSTSENSNLILSRIKLNISDTTGSASAIYLGSISNYNLTLRDVVIWGNLNTTQNLVTHVNAQPGTLLVERTNITTFNSSRTFSGMQSYDVVINNSRFNTRTNTVSFQFSNGVKFLNNFVNNSNLVFQWGNHTLIENSDIYQYGGASIFDYNLTMRNTTFTSPNSGGFTVGSFSIISGSTISANGGNGGIFFNRLRGVNQTFIVDSTVAAGIRTIRIDGGGDGDNRTFNITLINTTITPSNTEIVSDDGNDTVYIYFKNHLDVLVNDSSGPIVSATVTVDDNSSNQVFSGSTDGSGRIVQQNITYILENRTGLEWFTNHTVNVTTSGYDPAGHRTNMSTNRFLTFTLSVLETVCIAETGVCWPTIQQAIDNATANQTVVITDDRTYSENITINRYNLTLTSNGTTLPTINHTTQDVVSLAGDFNSITSVKINASGTASISAVIASLGSDNITFIDVEISVDSSGTSYGAHNGDFPGGDWNFHNVTITMINGTEAIHFNGIDGYLINNSYINVSGAATNAVNCFFGCDNGEVLSTQMFGGTDEVMNHAATALTVRDSTFLTTEPSSNGLDGDSNGNHWVITNVTINVTGSAFTGPGINRTVRSSVLEGDTYSVNSISGGNANVSFTIIDTIVTGTVRMEDNTDSTNLTFINTTATPYNTELSFCAAGDHCEILFINYLDVLVNDSSSPISGATVTVDNSSGGQVFSGSTDGSGRIVKQNITFGIVNTTGTFWLTNHTVNVSNAGYSSQGQVANMSQYRFLTFTLSTTFTDCGETSNVTNCVDIQCLEYHNLTGTRLVVFDENGSVDITSAFTTGSVQSEAEFVIRNGSNDVVASINSTGAMYILGTVTDEQGVGCTEPSEGFVIRNGTGTCVAYIDNSGNLWAKEQICYNSNIV